MAMCSAALLLGTALSGLVGYSGMFITLGPPARAAFSYCLASCLLSAAWGLIRGRGPSVRRWRA